MNLVLFIALALFWGGSFVAIKFVVEGMPPLLGAFLRVLIAVAIILLMFRIQKRSLRLPKGTHLKVWFAGLFSLGIPFSLLFWGEQSVSAGLAGILNGTVPIWTALLSISLIRTQEVLDFRKSLGVGIGLIGTAIVFGPNLAEGSQSDSFWGALAVLGMAVGYAVGVLLSRRVTADRRVSLEANLYHQHLSSLSYLGICALVEWSFGFSQVETEITQEMVISLLYLASFSTAFGMMIFFYLIREWGSVRSSAVTYIVPIVGLFLDYWIHDNLATEAQVVGIGVILLGVFLLQSPSLQRTRAPLIGGKSRVSRPL